MFITKKKLEEEKARVRDEMSQARYIEDRFAGLDRSIRDLYDRVSKLEWERNTSSEKEVTSDGR